MRKKHNAERKKARKGAGGGTAAVQKRCEMCGNLIDTLDNRRKYCDGCRKVRKSLFDADALKRYRKAARDKRKQDAERLKQLEEENQALREMLVQYRVRFELMQAVIKKYQGG